MEDPKFDIQKVNLDLLRRKCCFVSGQNLKYENEYEDNSKKKVLKSFFELGDILPIQLKKGIAIETALAEEIKEASKLLPSNDEESQASARAQISASQFRNTLTEEERKELLSKFELI